MIEKIANKLIVIRDKSEWNPIETLFNSGMNFKARVQFLGGKVKIKYFLDKDEALKWAREEKK